LDKKEETELEKTIPSTAKRLAKLEQHCLDLGNRVCQIESVVKMMLIAQTQMNEDMGIIYQAMQSFGKTSDKNYMKFGPPDDDDMIN